MTLFQPFSATEAFFDALAFEARQSWTYWLMGLTAVAWLSAKLAPSSHPRFRAMFFFAGLHLLAIVVASALLATGSPHVDAFLLPGWMLGGVAIVGAVATVLFSVVLPRLRLTIPRIVQDVVVAVASIVACLTIASKANVNLSGIIATSAVLSAVLGFSLQDVIGNVAGGLALQLDSSVEEGDWVKVADVTGRVVQIRWRFTAIETRNWETVIIPNSVLMKSQVTLLARRGGKPPLARRWVTFNVDWRHQPSDVIDAVQTAVRGQEHALIAKDPAPTCVLMDLAESYGRYAVRYWLKDLAVDDPTDSDVRTCIFFALQRAGMSPAIPAHAVFVTEETSDRAQVKTSKQLERRKALVEKLELFSVLSPDERLAVAAQLKYSPFTAGEVMTRQSAAAHWLYLMEDGRAEVEVHVDGLERTIAGLSGPNVFGEMSLLTGEPRSATVKAITDVECFRLDKGVVATLLERRPELAQQLAELLAKRRVALTAAKEGLDAEALEVRKKSDTKDLLSQIKRFFSL